MDGLPAEPAVDWGWTEGVWSWGSTDKKKTKKTIRSTFFLFIHLIYLKFYDFKVWTVWKSLKTMPFILYCTKRFAVFTSFISWTFGCNARIRPAEGAWAPNWRSSSPNLWVIIRQLNSAQPWWWFLHRYPARHQHRQITQSPWSPWPPGSKLHASFKASPNYSYCFSSTQLGLFTTEDSIFNWVLRVSNGDLFYGFYI